jgi:CheY-like chemotaxis protein
MAPRHILSVSSAENIRKTRELLLESIGYSVLSVAARRDMEHACRRGIFDLIIIDHLFTPQEKRGLAEAARLHCPRVPLLELCRISPEIPDAEFILREPEPEAFLSTVKQILTSFRATAG